MEYATPLINPTITDEGCNTFLFIYIYIHYLILYFFSKILFYKIISEILRNNSLVTQSISDSTPILLLWDSDIFRVEQPTRLDRRALPDIAHYIFFFIFIIYIIT